MKVALVGYEVEGQASYRYFKDKASEIVIFDEADKPGATPPEGVKVFSGDEAISTLKTMQFDKVVRTPKLSPHKLTGVKNVTTATKEFFAHCPAPIIGVTGTKGKGTTCTLIAEMLKAAGKTVWLVGNIGVPALDVLDKIKPDDIIVYELSSFQLWDLDKSPHIAVVLMIEADHLDVHDDFEDYLQAKMNIAAHQTADDEVIYHPTNASSQAVANCSAATKKKYLTPEGAYIAAGTVVINEQKICSIDEIGLLGPHNLENICAAITATWNFTQDVAAVRRVIKNFKGLEHRLEFVKEINGIRFYNDSFSSAPGATLAAMKSFTEPEIVIMGGYDKHGTFDDFAAETTTFTNIKKILLIGQTKDLIATSLRKAGIHNFETLNTSDFEEIIKTAYSVADPGDVVLLSPACASFDMFQNFYKRGEQFKKIVSQLHA